MSQLRLFGKARAGCRTWLEQLIFFLAVALATAGWFWTRPQLRSIGALVGSDGQVQNNAPNGTDE